MCIFVKKQIKNNFMIVPRFDKKQLAIVLGLATYTGRVYYTRLRIEVFTDQFLQQIGLSKQDYQGKKIWPIQVRAKIMTHLQLTKDDFNND
jgi:hypothetical protein